MSGIFEEVVAKLEASTPPSFSNVVTELEKHAPAKHVFETGVCVPGLDNYDCLLTRIIENLKV
jgi:hypothetical protein